MRQLGTVEVPQRCVYECSKVRRVITTDKKYKKRDKQCLSLFILKLFLSFLS